MTQIEQTDRSNHLAAPSCDVVFVIPFISRHAARDFSHSSALLGQTLSALRKQRWCRFEIIVVSNDVPECSMDGVVFVRSDVLIVNPHRRGSYQVDKERKVGIGLAEAAALGPKYIMCVDADDVVSPFLGWRLKRSRCDVIALRAGWIYGPEAGVGYLSLRFYAMCGTSLAFRPTVVPIPPIGYDFAAVGHNRLLEAYWTVSGHKQDPRRIAKEQGLSFAQIYWPLAYYRVWAGSLSSNSRRLFGKSFFINFLKRILFPVIDSRVRRLTR